ncbi:MAG: E3 ubiquitin protein ligase [Candidatus Heimdallarchaeota archaeon]|nr:MAG: E3 ubiquitin protein ligase [Candidatus Heimdallarchaeota archaeon]
MTSNVTKLSRLSRNKTTGNFIISILLLIGITFSLNVIGIVSSNIDRFTLVIGFFLSILFTYLVDRKLRQPFFSETSRYLEELLNRRYDVQQAAVQIELIEPLQKMASIKEALRQIDELIFLMEEILNLTSDDLSMISPSIRKHDLKKELREIKKIVEEFLEEARKKRRNIEFLANIRHIILDSIGNQLSRPQNEIEVDYLLYKVHKHIKSQITDEYLLKQVLEHILLQGEIIGKLNQIDSGDLILNVERSYEGESIDDISWDNGDKSEKSCVICRYPIRSQENSVECPSCQNSFHRNHLLEWLKVFNQCPMCHQRLTLFSNPS